MPIDYANYPLDWLTAIRPRILQRADNKCEHCGLENGIVGYRDLAGNFWRFPSDPPPSGWIAALRLTKIVLTIAHLDHNIQHNTDDNLAALCQRCHLIHDAKHHARNAARTRRQRQIDHGQRQLFD